MFGQDVKYNFYRCTGWPLVSAELGGYPPPEQMLEEAKLMPCDVERERESYHRMLSEVVPLMNERFRCFFRQQDRKNLNEAFTMRC